MADNMRLTQEEASQLLDSLESIPDLLERIDRLRDETSDMLASLSTLLDGALMGVSPPVCKKCGRKMRMVISRNYPMFWGCSGYRDKTCASTLNYYSWRVKALQKLAGRAAPALQEEPSQ